MLLLKQSTAATLKIGPFLDNVDGVTAETGLTIAQANVRLSKNGGNIAQKNESTTCTHDELGYYDCPVDATDTGTLGRLELYVSDAAALPVFHEFLVVTANVYNTFCSTDYFDVNLVADQSAATIGDVSTKTGYSLSAAGVDAILDEAISGHSTTGTVGKVLSDLNDEAFGKWAISGLVLTIYKADGVSVLKQFDLDSATAPTTRTPK